MTQLMKSERRAFIWFLLALLVLLLFILQPFLLPIFLGIVLVIVFYPLYKGALKLTRGRRYLASFLATFTVTFFLFVPGALITSLIANQLYGVADQVVQFVDTGQLLALFQKWNVNVQHYMDLIEQQFRIQVNLRGAAANAVKQFAYYVYQYSPNVLAQTLTFFLQGFIMLIVVFFLFVEGGGIYREFLIVSPMKDTHENALALEMRNMIYAVIYGSFVTALTQGVLAGLIFYFLGIHGFLVWGALTFLFSFIPIIGAAGVWAPASIILILTGNIWSGVILIALGVGVISMVDNILKPLLMRGKSKIHPALLFLSILGGIKLVGPIGILLGPIAIAVFLAALKIYKQDFLPTRRETSSAL